MGKTRDATGMCQNNGRKMGKTRDATGMCQNNGRNQNHTECALTYHAQFIFCTFYHLQAVNLSTECLFISCFDKGQICRTSVY